MSGEQIQAIANLVNFALFIGILVKWVFPAAGKLVTTRHAEHVAMVHDAEEAHRLAAESLKATNARLAGVDAELSGLVDQARKLAASQGADIEATAREDAKRLREAATADIQRERQAAVREIRHLVMNQAFSRAEGELQAAMNGDRQRELVNALVQKVGDGSLALK
ncbi:MAG TPA: ATP synthase F0 subunit B [Oscillatoriaceae cyanobacterium]